MLFDDMGYNKEVFLNYKNMTTLHTPDSTTPVDPSQEDEALYAAVMRDDRAHREKQARLENGDTAEVVPLTLAWSWSLSTTQKANKGTYAILTPPTPEELADVNNAKIGTHFRGADTLTGDDQDWLKSHGYNV